MILIRKARVKDIPRITELSSAMLNYHAKFDSSFTLAKDAISTDTKYFKSCLYSKRKLLLVAERDDAVIGYALGSISKRPPVFKIKKMGHLSDMFIIEKYRKSGIGGMLLKELFSWYKNKNIEYVELMVHVKNEIGKKVWAKYGFKDVMTKRRVCIKNKQAHKLLS